MLFTSWQFAVFFPLVAVLSMVLTGARRLAMLLAASYAFYMCALPEHAILLCGSTLLDFWLAGAIGRSGCQRKRKLLLTVSILCNLGVLFLFKYFNLFALAATRVSEGFGVSISAPVSDLLLPIGISFYTFQTMSYTIDVYRGDAKPETSLLKYALYVSFFPQLVAGPIERASGFLSQLRRDPAFDEDRIFSGLSLACWGFFKKLVVADHLAEFVDRVYAQPESLSGPHYVVATVFFSFQIYCDFSGYSDIAIGTARVLGISLSKNFNRPYAAHNLREFWSRWHISLSTWFRDYVYKPLGGNRISRVRTSVNLVAVFLISGLWHGAHAKYVYWGALHAVLLLVSVGLSPLYRSFLGRLGIHRNASLLLSLQTVVVFAAVSFAWIFFRAENLEAAVSIIQRIPTGWGNVLAPEWRQTMRQEVGFPQWYFTSAAVLVIGLQVVESAAHNSRRVRLRTWWDHFPLVRWASRVALVLVILNFGADSLRPFIYFQF